MFDLKELGRNVHQITLKTTGKNWEQWFLLSSDWHWDNPKCDRALLTKHLNQAKERNAGIFGFGDLLCLMQGKYDPRGTKSDIRPEHNRSDYLDVVIRDLAQYLIPYKQNMILYARGNHETNIRKRLETDPVERVVERVNVAHGGRAIYSGGYGGWLRFHFHTHTSRQSINLKYFHGSGGGGVVTKGAIQQQRIAASVEGADIVYMGHVHEHGYKNFPKELLSPDGEVKIKNSISLRGSTYKEEYGDGFGGWHIERGAPPKPLGSWWLRFFKQSQKKVGFEWIPTT